MASGFSRSLIRVASGFSRIDAVGYCCILLAVLLVPSTSANAAQRDGAAVALYRDLRQKYYGGQAYDFRESVLRSLAQQALAANKPDDALAFLRLNLEFYPGSVGSYLALADAHTRKRDRAAARQDL